MPTCTVVCHYISARFKELYETSYLITWNISSFIICDSLELSTVYLFRFYYCENDKINIYIYNAVFTNKKLYILYFFTL